MIKSALYKHTVTKLIVSHLFAPHPSALSRWAGGWLA